MSRSKKKYEKEIVISTLSENAEYYFKISKKDLKMTWPQFLIVKKNWHGSTSFVLDHDK